MSLSPRRESQHSLQYRLAQMRKTGRDIAKRKLECIDEYEAKRVELEGQRMACKLAIDRLDVRHAKELRHLDQEMRENKEQLGNTTETTHNLSGEQLRHRVHTPTVIDLTESDVPVSIDKEESLELKGTASEQPGVKTIREGLDTDSEAGSDHDKYDSAETKSHNRKSQSSKANDPVTKLEIWGEYRSRTNSTSIIKGQHECEHSHVRSHRNTTSGSTSSTQMIKSSAGAPPQAILQKASPTGSFALTTNVQPAETSVPRSSSKSSTTARAVRAGTPTLLADIDPSDLLPPGSHRERRPVGAYKEPISPMSDNERQTLRRGFYNDIIKTLKQQSFFVGSVDESTAKTTLRRLHRCITTSPTPPNFFEELTQCLIDCKILRNHDDKHAVDDKIPPKTRSVYRRRTGLDDSARKQPEAATGDENDVTVEMTRRNNAVEWLQHMRDECTKFNRDILLEPSEVERQKMLKGWRKEQQTS